jgi:hypothetical protein
LALKGFKFICWTLELMNLDYMVSLGHDKNLPFKAGRFILETEQAYPISYKVVRGNEARVSVLEWEGVG